MQTEINDLEQFVKDVNDISIDQVNISSFYIPDWRIENNVHIKLDKRKFFVINLFSDGLLKAKKIKKRVRFSLFNNGVMSFGYSDFPSEYGKYYISDHDNDLNRLNCLLLFEQFKEEIFSKVLSQLKDGASEHNEIIQKAKQAFAPFVPYVVADKLDG